MISELNGQGDFTRNLKSSAFINILEKAFYLSTGNGDVLFDIIEKLDHKNDAFRRDLHISINQVDDATVRTSLNNAFRKVIECRRNDYNYSKMSGKCIRLKHSDTLRLLSMRTDR